MDATSKPRVATGSGFDCAYPELIITAADAIIPICTLILIIFSILFGGRLLDAVDDESLDRPCLRFQFEPELFLNGREDCRNRTVT